MSRTRVPMSPPPVVEPDEEEEMDEDEDEEMDEGMDMFEMLGSLLTTEDGESIAEIVKRQADSAEKIALALDMQNKIMVKILSAISKLVPTPVVQAADPA